jgi:hypothetical protein
MLDNIFQTMKQNEITQAESTDWEIQTEKRKVRGWTITKTGEAILFRLNVIELPTKQMLRIDHRIWQDRDFGVKRVSISC